MFFFHLFHITLFVGSALLLVPRKGIEGYGWAEVVTVMSYLVIHFFVVNAVGRPSYRHSIIWAAGFGLVLFWQDLGWVAALGIVVVVAWPETWRTLNVYTKDIWRVLRG
jgi:PST family polysaccharide transporter